jgi:hypothetical protein
MLRAIGSALVLALALTVLSSIPPSAQERPSRELAIEAAKAWESVDHTDPKELEAFIKHYGDTFYGDLARNRLAKLSLPGRRIGIEGTYEARGTNPNGSTYRGDVSIKADGNAYFFHWCISGQTFQGNGVLQGKSISVDWGQQHPVIYQVGSDGVLRGKWDNGRATEDLFPKVQTVGSCGSAQGQCRRC